MVTACGTLLIILGVLPKFGQIVANIPGPVIGGAATVMFAMVTAVESAVSVAVREGAVAVDVPDDGVLEHGEVETERVEPKA